MDADERAHIVVVGMQYRPEEIPLDIWLAERITNAIRVAEKEAETRGRRAGLQDAATQVEVEAGANVGSYAARFRALARLIRDRATHLP